MIVYNKQWLYNLYARHEADEAFHRGMITKAENEAIRQHHAYHFYTPNIFVRTGLFLLTLIIALMTIGLMSLPFMSADTGRTIGVVAIIVGVMSYVALELFATKKNHFDSGIDHALMIITICGIIGGLNGLLNISKFMNAFMASSVSAYFAIRFTDAGMAVIALCGSLFMITIGIVDYISPLKDFLPFILMAFCGCMLILLNRVDFKSYRYYYFKSLLWLEVAAAFGLYAFGNYYVVKEIGYNMLYPGTTASALPFPYIFWPCTILIPLIYLAYGMLKKSILYIRVSLLCIVAMAFTLRYYYHYFTIESVLTLTGIGLIGLSWFLIRYLKRPKRDFTSEKPDHIRNFYDVESLIIIESFANQAQPDQGTLYQGGSGGGGGASGNY